MLPLIGSKDTAPQSRRPFRQSTRQETDSGSIHVNGLDVLADKALRAHPRLGAGRPRGAADAVQRAMIASISATVFGTSRLSTSPAPAVTATSSSMRMPMCQYCSGTSAAGRM